MAPRALNLPPACSRGATLGIVAPSSPVDPQRFHRGLAALRRAGFRTALGRHVEDRRGHLAGRDEDRAADLNEMFAREEVHGILCARGGSGSIRLLELLDYERMARSPKVFIGSSDVTSIQLALLRHCRLPSFFGPMAQPDFAPGLGSASLDCLLRQIGSARPAGELRDDRIESEARTLVGGQAAGPCMGGTVSLLAASVGTAHLPDFRGALLFFEDIHESPARIERYLAQLRHAGILEAAAGFLIGHCRWEAGDEERARYLEVEQVYQDFLAPLGKPAVCGIPIGHVPDPLTIPQGVRARLDADRKSLEILEAAVRPPSG